MKGRCCVISSSPVALHELPGIEPIPGVGLDAALADVRRGDPVACARWARLAYSNGSGF